MPTNQDDIVNQADLRTDRCACCGLSVAGLIENAHIPNKQVNPDKTVPLCILCHRAYDIALTTEDEIETIRDRWLRDESPPFKHPELSKLWASRVPDWSKLHQGAAKRAGKTRRRRAAGRKAAKTRAANANASGKG
jgi:hypothetical protein